ncbi:hypothetical protein IV454_26045 [Massilia antarctica]|uniref:Uncharacterized protein n=2 Tax=Massilia antarctica TaxID=2765360 RepID=A0AA49A737_9BURK|nr:contractile injection system tape measure protein [Massilia antarctica]QPI48919.1 hypothetical protein IV454_26045 [Massilia antarctica]
MSAVHRIGELLIELTFESDAPRPQPVPHERLLELVKGRMLPELEAVLDEMDDGRLRRVERLDIDLGDVPAHLLDAELGERLRELLRGALGDALRANPGVAADAGALAHDAALFERFLRSGAVDGRGDTPAALLERLLANDALALPGIVRRAAAVAGAVKRLAQQIDGGQLRRLLPLLAQEAGAWLALVDAIGAALAGDAGARRQQARTLWELVLAHVLDAPCGEVTPALRAAAGALGADASAQTRALLLAIGIDSASRAPGPGDAQARFAQALSAADAASIRADWDELVAHHAPALRAVMLRRGADQALWQRIATHFPLSMLDDMATLAGSAATGRERDAWAGAMFEALAPAAAADARIKQFVRMLAEANPDYLPFAWTALRTVHADALAGAMRGIGARHDVWQRVAQRFPLALLDELTMLLAPQALSIPEQHVAARTPAQARNAWLAGMMHLSAVPFDAARYRAALRAPGTLVVKLWQRIEACLATEADDQLPEILRQEIAAHAAGSVSPADFLRAAWDDLRQGTTFNPAAVEARAATAFVLRALLDADASALSDMAGEPARAAIAHIGANAQVWTRVAQRFPVALLDKMTMLMAPQAPAVLHRLGSAAVAERDCWFASMMHLAAEPFDAARYTAAMTDAIGTAAQARIVAALLAADAASLPPDAFSAYGGAARIAIASIGARSDVWERVTQRFPPDVLHRMTALLAPQASELLRELPDCGPERWLASFMHLTVMPFDAASYAAALGLTWGADAGQRIFSALLAGDAANLPADIFSTHSDAARAVIARIGARGDVWERVAQRFPVDVLARMTALLAPQSRPPVQDRKRWLASFVLLASGAGMEQGIYSALLAGDAASLPAGIFGAHRDATRAAIARIGARGDVWERVAQRFPPDVLHRMTALLAPQAADVLRGQPIRDPEHWLASFMHLTDAPFDAARYATALGVTGRADIGQRILSALLSADAANLPADVFSEHSDAARAAITAIGARADVWERVARQFPLDVLGRMAALLAPQGELPIHDRDRWLARFMQLAAKPSGPAAMDVTSRADIGQRIRSALLAADAAKLPAEIFDEHSDAAREAIARIGARADVWERVARQFPLDVLGRMTALLAPQGELPIHDRDRWLARFMQLAAKPSGPAAMGATSRAEIAQRILSALLAADTANLPEDIFGEHSDVAREAIARIGARADVWEKVAQRFPLDVLDRMTALLAPQGAPPTQDRNGWLARFMQLAAKPSGPAAMDVTSRAAIVQRIWSALLAADAAKLPAEIFDEHSDAAREAIARIGARADVWEKVAQRFPLDVLDRMTALLAPQGAPPTQDRNRWLARFMQLAAKPSGPAAMDVTSRADIVQRIWSALLAADAANLPAEIFGEHSDAAREAIARIGPRADAWERVAQRFQTDVLGRMMALLAPQGEPPIQDRNRWLARFMQLAAKPSGPAAMSVTSRADIGQQIWSALLAADAANLPEDIFGEHSDATREAIARIGARGDVWERVARRFPLDVLERMTALLAPQAGLPIRDRDHWLATFMPLAAMPFDAHRHVAALVPGAPARQNQRTPAIPVLRERIDSAADPERLILSALMSSDADAFEAALRDVQDDGARKAIAHIGARFDVWQAVAQRFPPALLGRITALLAPRAAIILRDLHAGAHAAAIPERRRWLASIMHLTTTPFDAARYAAAMSAVAIDTGSEADTESAQRILSALLAADAAALQPDTLVVHADAARQAIARIGARADVWQPVARRFPLALLDEMTALMAPAAPAILRQPPIASGGAALPARERWLASIMHLAATPFDPVRYAAAVGAPVPPDARSGDTAQPLQRILAALGDADAAALTPDLLSTHDDAARQAIARTGARFDVWQRVALRFPLALLDELTTLVAPQAPAILRGIAAASGAPARDLWLASIMHLAVTPFDAQRYSAALRAPSAHMIDLWRQVAARTAAVENQLQRDMQMQAIAAHAAHSASPPDFLRAAHDALGHAQRIDLTAVDARARTAFLLRALVDGDPAGLTPAVFAGLGDHARKAIMDIGARAAVWEPVAQDFPTQVLDALSALLEPHAASTPASDRARWLAAIMRLTAAPAPAAQAATPAAHGDTTSRLRQAIKAHMASPDSVLQHAIDAHAERSADTAGFLRVVLTALEAGAEIDLEAIAGQVDSQPAAAEPPPASAAPSTPEDPMPAAPTIHAQSDPDVLRRIAAHLDNAGEHGKTLLGAAQAHASRSAAPQAYLGQVLDDLANERAVDLDDLDQRFAAAPPPAPKRAAVSCARALAAHAPAQRAALAHLLHGAGDDSAQFSAGLLDSVVTLLAGADLEAVQRCAREVGGALARDLPAPAAARIGMRTRQFAFGWFFEQRLRFEPAAYARSLASHLTEPAGVAAPAQRHASALRPALTPATASLLDDECDALYLSNAGQVLAGPYLPRLFAMVGLTEGARFKNAEAAERAVHLVQFIVSGQTDCPEYQLGLNKVLCGLKLSAPIVREIVPTGEEREAVDTMLRAMIAHWKTIGNTSPDGLRQAFLQRPGSMHLKDDAWRLKVEAGSFDMLLDALPWSFSVIRHPWMERAVHVEWR